MSDKVKDSASQFHDEGLYLPSRTLTIFGDIDEDMLYSVVKNLHVIDNHSQGPITILLTSEGGCVTSGLGIYNAIRYCKNLVRIIAVGEVSSMATVIFQAGDERLMYEDAFLMLHEGETSLTGRQGDIASWSKLYKDQEKRMLDIYTRKIKNKKPRYSKDKLNKELLWDRIFTADEALEWGLCDKVIKESY